MSERRPLFGVLVLAGLVGAAFLAQAWMRPEPVEAPEAQVQDTGRSIDFEHPRQAVLVFLTEVLATGTPEGRRSAARAFVVAGHPSGVEPLFDAAAQGGDDTMLFCLAALEILRLQTADETWRELVRALERQPPLPVACRLEVRDRHGLIDGEDGPALAGAEDADPVVRAWSARRLTEVPEAGPAFILLVADPDARVRKAAWLALAARDTTAIREELGQAAAAEQDAEIVPLAAEVVR